MYDSSSHIYLFACVYSFTCASSFACVYSFSCVYSFPCVYSFQCVYLFRCIFFYCKRLFIIFLSHPLIWNYRSEQSGGSVRSVLEYFYEEKRVRTTKPLNVSNEIQRILTFHVKIYKANLFFLFWRLVNSKRFEIMIWIKEKCSLHIKIFIYNKSHRSMTNVEPLTPVS